MASKIKFDLIVKKNGCLYEWKIPSLGVDGFSTCGFGTAIDNAIREVNSFFKGLVTSGDGLRRLDVSSVPVSVTLELGFRVLKESQLSDFSLSDISGETSIPCSACAEPAPDQASDTAEPAPATASKKVKAKS